MCINVIQFRYESCNRNRVKMENALTLQWSFGFSKDVPGGALNLCDGTRDALFYSAAQTGVVYDYSARRQKLLQGHCNPISCVVVSLNKKWLITADAVGKDRPCREASQTKPGQSRQGKPSDYGIQLQAKQKLKAYYGNINERQFRNIYKKASMLKGDTSENLIGLLERRLDAVIYRAKFSTTIFSARQLINHGHVKVNGKKVNIASYSVNEEDLIEIRDKSKQLAIIDIALASKERETPEYIQMDQKNKKFKFVRIPKFEEVPYPIVMEPNLVIEYYSR